MNPENIKNITNHSIEQLIEALKAGKSEALTNYLPPWRSSTAKLPEHSAHALGRCDFSASAQPAQY